MQSSLDILSQYPGLYLSLTALFALAIGSFLNVVIYRLPVMLEQEWRDQCLDYLEQPADETQTPFNLLVPRSKCRQCGHQITAAENIPVLSYLFLRGRCRDCGTRISMRYPVIEILTAVLTVSVVWHFGLTLEALAASFLTWALIALSLIDIDHRLLPDRITLPFLWLGLTTHLFISPLFHADLHAAVTGAVVGYMSLWLLFHGYRLATGKHGMGFGDFKLVALFGAWLGWQQLPLIILMASAVGAVTGILGILIGRHDRNHPIPFGPFLCAAGWIAMLWGNEITGAYLQIARFGY